MTDRSVQEPAILRKGFSWVITFLVPIALVLTIVRSLFTPLFLQLQYNSPGFPDDLYGFTKEDRLYWSGITMEYLLNDAGIEFLGDLRFADGAVVYNERELRHMVDVKIALQAAFRVWLGSLAALFLLGLAAWRAGWWSDFRRGLAYGGWLTVLLLAAILMFALLAFGAFFTAFHNVFFQPGTWMFLWSDTLIRLFPERFWFNIFIVVGVLSMLGGLMLAYLFRERRMKVSSR